ncbi:MAG: hypothetical protein QM724_01110 [Flavobacteriales bacterium]
MRLLLLLSSICLCAAARAQLLTPIALDTVKEFRSLERALEDPEHVYRLDLSRNKLKEVPEDIRRLKNLNALDLGRNKLKTLPVWLGELRYMQEFRAGHNKFSEVPPVICQWQDLRRLRSERERPCRPARLHGHAEEVVRTGSLEQRAGGFPRRVARHDRPAVHGPARDPVQ